MSIHKHRIHEVLKRPLRVLEKVNHRRYLTNKKEPVENISEMSQPNISVTRSDAVHSARQRQGIRKLALSLRILKNRK